MTAHLHHVITSCNYEEEEKQILHVQQGLFWGSSPLLQCFEAARIKPK